MVFKTPFGYQGSDYKNRPITMQHLETYHLNKDGVWVEELLDVDAPAAAAAAAVTGATAAAATAATAATSDPADSADQVKSIQGT